MNPDDTVVIPTGGCHDCGGGCIFKVHVKNGVAIRAESDDGEEPQLRACVRGRAYRKRVYDPNRLKYPMKRIGARGEGKFERISWDEALDTVARELIRVKETYGPSAIFCLGYSGSIGKLHGAATTSRLLNMFGGCTGVWGLASYEGGAFAENVVYGAMGTGSTQDNILNSRLIIMWGWNPAVTIQGTNTTLYLARAKEAGTKIICIDPRFTESTAIFADQWIPIRPGTDAAMMIAMAYVILKENLQDQKFLDTYTIGFDKFKDYVMGVEDGVPKTPAWAEAITTVPAATIENLAREYATTKPAMLRPGYAPGRTAYGEQYHRAAMTLTAMTGNVGISGGDASGSNETPLLVHWTLIPTIPQGDNPAFIIGGSAEEELDILVRNQTSVPLCRTWDAILEGKAGGYPADIKLSYIVCANPITQTPNTNKGIRALNKLEFIIVHEQFMTPTAKFADILLPANTFWERNDISLPWVTGPYYIYQNKVIDSLYESKSDFQISRELAPRLGITNYDEGKTDEEWLREIAGLSTDMTRDIPDYDTFKRDGVHKIKTAGPVVRFKKQIEDPKNNPFPTPSGKIEIYSQRLAELNKPKLPPIPKYIETWESVNDPLARKYPLQLITIHFKTRAHSIFDNIPWLRELESQSVWINSTDAQARSISDGDEVRVFNDRGEMIIPVKVTERIMPGVIAIGEGAWYKPDKTGTDRGGCPNVLTREEYSPGGSFPYNTSLVQVQKA